MIEPRVVTNTQKETKRQPLVAPPLSLVFYLDLLGRPLVQIDRFDSGDVHAEVTVDPGTADTHEHPEVPGSPSRT